MEVYKGVFYGLPFRTMKLLSEECKEEPYRTKLRRVVGMLEGRINPVDLFYQDPVWVERVAPGLDVFSCETMRSILIEILELHGIEDEPLKVVNRGLEVGHSEPLEEEDDYLEAFNEVIQSEQIELDPAKVLEVLKMESWRLDMSEIEIPLRISLTRDQWEKIDCGNEKINSFFSDPREDTFVHKNTNEEYLSFNQRELDETLEEGTPHCGVLLWLKSRSLEEKALRRLFTHGMYLEVSRTQGCPDDHMYLVACLRHDKDASEVIAKDSSLISREKILSTVLKLMNVGVTSFWRDQGEYISRLYREQGGDPLDFHRMLKYSEKEWMVFAQEGERWTLFQYKSTKDGVIEAVSDVSTKKFRLAREGERSESSLEVWNPWKSPDVFVVSS